MIISSTLGEGPTFPPESSQVQDVIAETDSQLYEIVKQDILLESGENPEQVEALAGMWIALGSLNTPRTRRGRWLATAPEGADVAAVEGLGHEKAYIMVLEDLVSIVEDPPEQPTLWQIGLTRLFESGLQEAQENGLIKPDASDVHEQGLAYCRLAHDALSQYWLKERRLEPQMKTLFNRFNMTVESLAFKLYQAHREDYHVKHTLDAERRPYPSHQIIAEFIRRRDREFENQYEG